VLAIMAAFHWRGWLKQSPEARRKAAPKPIVIPTGRRAFTRAEFENWRCCSGRNLFVAAMLALLAFGILAITLVSWFQPKLEADPHDTFLRTVCLLLSLGLGAAAVPFARKTSRLVKLVSCPRATIC